MKVKEQGLYLPEFEHDNCGAGFICSLKGEKTNNIIPKALNILTCLEHRGAVSSDGKTGDGAGMVRIWDVAKGAPEKPMPPIKRIKSYSSSEVRFILWDSTGNNLVVCHADGAIYQESIA